MRGRTDNLLRVRRIAVVFDALVPDDLPDDLIAFRLMGNVDLLTHVTGIEILPADREPMPEVVKGPRRNFDARMDARRAAMLARRAAEVGARAALVVQMAAPRWWWTAEAPPKRSRRAGYGHLQDRRRGAQCGGVLGSVPQGQGRAAWL